MLWDINSVVSIILFRNLIVCSQVSSFPQPFDVVRFPHETCQLETLSSYSFKTFHRSETFLNDNGVMELLVRFKGVADGFIALTQNSTISSDDEYIYLILLGSYNNRFSEIRRTKRAAPVFKINTPGILSESQFRGFLIRFNPNDGSLWVFAEGSSMPLLHWQDPQPLSIEYFSFATYHKRIIQAAFNCQPKDDHSLVPHHKEACQTETLSGFAYDAFYKVGPFLNEFRVLELLVRFKGSSDGHVALTQSANDTNPLYLIVMGSYGNKQSEIRRSQLGTPVFKMNTPGIMSDQQFRGFLIRFSSASGELWVFSEGSEMPLLHWKDPAPLYIRYFSFSAYYGKVVQVAFNCQPTDAHSSIPNFSKDYALEWKYRNILSQPR